MSDAAHYILTRPSREYTGKFFVDEQLLRDKCGVTNFEKYACVPGEKLMLDFFLEEAPADFLDKSRFAKASNPKQSKL